MHGNALSIQIKGVLTAFLTLLTPSALAGAQPTSSEALEEVGAPVNAVCPVMPDETVDPRFVFVYEGKAIGLCCRRCLSKFQADPAAYATNLQVLHAQEAESDKNHHTRTEAREELKRPVTTPSTPSDAGEGDAALEHEHAHERGGRSKLLDWIGEFHPPATDLPIGLLLGAAIAEIGMIATKRVSFRHAAGFCLALGTLGAIAAATLGWLNGGLVLWDSDWVQATHRWLGTGVATLSVVTSALYIRMSRTNSNVHAAFRYRCGLLITTILVGAAGFFGGALVYGIDHYAW